MVNSDLSRVLQGLWEYFRSAGASVDTALIVSWQVLAWAKLSKSKSIPDDFSLENFNHSSQTSKLNHIFAELPKLYFLGNNVNAFGETSTFFDDKELFGFNKIALDIKEQELLEKIDILSYSIDALSEQIISFYPSIPIEILKFTIGIAGEIEGKSIYCPWDDLSEFASILDDRGAKPSIEAVRTSPLPWLVNILGETNIEILVSNPIERPSFRLKNELRKFDLSVAFPPLSEKYDPARIRWGMLDNRFPERTGSGAVLHIRHLLAQTIGKVIVAVPNSLLFSTGVEQSLRQNLLERNQIEAVISMPPALLHQNPVPFSMLVLDNQPRSSDRISFVNGSDEKFFTKDGRGRSWLVGWQDLLDTLQQGEDKSYVVRIPVQEVLDNNSYLEVSTYILPPERRQIERVLGNSRTDRLNDIVEFLRPPLRQKLIDEGSSNRGTEALEVTIDDFLAYGYARTPTRIVTIDKNQKGGSRNFLQSGDILLAVKANTGKVAIISDAADRTKDLHWTANQSCLILRCRGEKIDPKVLFMYLVSEMGQYLLRSMSSGATIPLIQLARLKELQVVIPPDGEAAQIIQDFDRMVELQSQKDALTQEQKNITGSHWGFTSFTKQLHLW